MRHFSRCILAIGLAALLLTPAFTASTIADSVVKQQVIQGKVAYKPASPGTDAEGGGRVVSTATTQGRVEYRKPCGEGRVRIGADCEPVCAPGMFRYRGTCRCPAGLTPQNGKCAEIPTITTCLPPKIKRGNDCIVPPRIVITPDSLPNGSYDATYGPVQLSASGGVAPYRYALSGGTFPLGLTLSSYGLVTGVPAQQGQFAFGITAKDSNGASAAKQYAISIKEAAQVPCPPCMVRFGANCVADTSPSCRRSPPPPPPLLSPPPEAGGDGGADLARPLQAELKRLGCLDGAVDGIWGAGSRRALGKFADKSGLSFDRSEPTQAAMRATRSRSDGYCDTRVSEPPPSRRCTGSNEYKNDEGRCVCDDGYERRGSQCVRVVKPVNCGQNAHASNGQCYCNEGYERRGDRNVCKQKKQQRPNCGSNAYVNDEGKCACDDGYERRGNRCQRAGQKNNGNSNEVGGGKNKNWQKCQNRCKVRAIGCMLKYNNENKCRAQAIQCLASGGCQ